MEDTRMSHTQYENLQREFIMHLFKRTRRLASEEFYRYQMQMLLDSLARYLEPRDKALLERGPFIMFDDLSFIPNGDDEDVYVSLSAQGTAIFHAWLRRRGFDPYVMWLTEYVPFGI